MKMQGILKKNINRNIKIKIIWKHQGLLIIIVAFSSLQDLLQSL